jgi:hypothetical protein
MRHKTTSQLLPWSVAVAAGYGVSLSAQTATPGCSSTISPKRRGWPTSIKRPSPARHPSSRGSDGVLRETP